MNFKRLINQGSVPKDPTCLPSECYCKDIEVVGRWSEGHKAGK